MHAYVPPMRKAVPRTRRRLESTEPRRETCTMRRKAGLSRPLMRASKAMIISVTLPNVAFSRPVHMYMHGAIVGAKRVIIIIIIIRSSDQQAIT